MKTTQLLAWTLGIVAVSKGAGLAQQQFFPPPVSVPSPTVAPPTPIAMPPPVLMPPPVVVAPPVVTAPPPVTAKVGVPDSYIWDGGDYVGMVGTDLFYLGPENVWIPCDAGRLDRFRAWAKDHAGWREHVLLNAKYRVDAQGHYVPLKSTLHDNPG